MRIITIKGEMKAFDTFGHITADQAKAMATDGYRAAGLYTAVCDAADLANCTSNGIGVHFIFEGLAKTTEPTPALGITQATAGIGTMRALGVPPGATYSADLEGDGRIFSDWIEYADSIASLVNKGMDISSSYIGEGTGLTSLELYQLSCVRYWKGASRVLDRHGELAEPSCGWAAIQGPIDVTHASGLHYDQDVLWLDYRSRSFSLVVAD
jgi:hypothetical protein